MKTNLGNHWLLLPIFIISIFGFSFQTIPILSWFFIPTLLAYTRYQSKRHILYVFITSIIGVDIAYLGVFRVTVNGPRYPGIPIITANSIASALLVVIMLFADRYVVTNSNSTVARVLMFPSIWTSLWFLFTLFGGIGDFFSISIALVNWPDFAQVASLGGRSLLDFLVALFGTVLLELSTFPTHALSLLASSKPLLATNDEEAPSKKQAVRLLLTHPVTKYVILMGALLIYGGARVNIHDNSLYQNSYTEYLPPLETVGCVVGPGLDYPEQQEQQDIWFEKSAVLAEAGAKLILWSELTTILNDTKAEATFIKQAQDFAISRQVYLGVTYGIGTPTSTNKLVFILKNGTIGIDYVKSHPVPGVELFPAGPNVLQYVDTEDFGRVGGGICFDYNFPDFIKQASTHKVDVMLQPSWTWGPIGTYHEQSNILRPVENGFTLFRCVSQGVSGIFEPTLNSVYNQKVASLNIEKYIFYLPIQKHVATLFGYTGFAFSYLCIFSTAFILILTKKSNRRINLQ